MHYFLPFLFCIAFLDKFPDKVTGFVTIVTTTLRPSCYEVANDYKSCRRKKQISAPLLEGFGPSDVAGFNVRPGTPESDVLPPSIDDYPVPEEVGESRKDWDSSPTPHISSSLNSDSAYGTQQRISMPRFLSVVTVFKGPTQSFYVPCLVSGSTPPSPQCKIKFGFPPVPAEMTLETYCKVLGDAAKMAVTSCELTPAKKMLHLLDGGKSRQSSSGVDIIFDKIGNGDLPSRQTIAKNIVYSLYRTIIGYLLPYSLSAVMFDPLAVKVPGFKNIFLAAGLNFCPNGDQTCGARGAGNCDITTGSCNCTAPYTLIDRKCKGVFTFPPVVKGWTIDYYCQAIERAAKAKTVCSTDPLTKTVNAVFSSLESGQPDPSIETVSANLANDLILRSYVKLREIKVPGFSNIYLAAKLLVPLADDFPDNGFSNIYLAAKLLVPLADDFPDNGCGSTKAGPFLTKIVGGQIVTEGAYPWMVELGGCGGALISNKFVLTAAHCFFDKNGEFKAQSVIGFFGTTKLLDDAEGTRTSRDQNVSIIKLQDVTIHPSYNSRSNLLPYDIALLRLPQALSFTDKISPVCLPPIASFPTPPTTTYTVAGWGSTKARPVDSTEPGVFGLDLKSVNVPVVQADKCYSNAKNYSVPLSASQICAVFDTAGQGDCQGDSGGPVFTYRDGMEKFTQVGIVSYGEGCGQANEPNVYTRVSSYLDWIVENTK